MDRRVTLLVVLSVSMLAVGAGALVMSRRQARAETTKTASCGMPMGDTDAASKLPKGTVPLPAATKAEFTGKAVCGFCSWGIGQDCNTMLYDRDGHHVAAVLPNDKLAELQKLTGTWASGRATVVAHGTLTQFQGMNYILLASFTTDAKPEDRQSMK